MGEILFVIWGLVALVLAWFVNQKMTEEEISDPGLVAIGAVMILLWPITFPIAMLSRGRS